MAVIDRQKYIKELSRLLAGMAPADREAVLRGVNARFDEAGDDSAAIKALGSPTYAAVQVLRGYVAPDPEEHPEAWVVTPEPEEGPAARPDTEATAEPAPATEGPVPEAEAAVEVAESAPEEAPEEEEAAEAAPAGTPCAAGPEAEAPADAAAEETPDEAEAEAVPEEAPAAGEAPDADDPEVPPEAAEADVDTPEAPQEPQEEAPLPEAVEVTEAAVDAAADDFPDIDAILSEAEAAASAESGDVAAPQEPEEEAPEEPGWGGVLPQDPEGLGKPVSGPPKPRAKPAALVFYSIAAVIVGIPVTALLAALALAVLAAAALVLFAGGLAISFCFLGLTVVADILMCAGAGLVLIGVGLPLAYFAVWIFVRGAVGFVNLVIRKGGDWCYDHGEVTGR